MSADTTNSDVVDLTIDIDIDDSTSSTNANISTARKRNNRGQGQGRGRGRGRAAFKNSSAAKNYSARISDNIVIQNDSDDGNDEEEDHDGDFEIIAINDDDDDNDIVVPKFGSNKKRKQSDNSLIDITTNTTSTSATSISTNNNNNGNTAKNSRSQSIDIDIVDITDSIVTARSSATTSTSTSNAAIARRRRNKSKSNNNNSIDATVSASTSAAASQSHNATPMSRILEIFPDMDIQHIGKHLVQAGISQLQFHTPLNEIMIPSPNINSYMLPTPSVPIPLDVTGNSMNNMNNINNINSNIVEFILQHTIETLANQPSYPKSEETTTSISTSTSGASASTKAFNYDYSSPSTKYERDTNYKQQCYQNLLHTFPFLSTNGLSSLLEKFDGRYYITHMYVIDQLKAGYKDALLRGTLGLGGHEGNGLVDLTSFYSSTSTYGSNHRRRNKGIASAAATAAAATTKKEWSKEEIEERQCQNLSRIIYQQCKLLPEQRDALNFTVTKVSTMNGTIIRYGESTNTTDITGTGTHTGVSRTVKIQTTLQRARKRHNVLKPHITNLILLDEIQYTDTKYKEWESAITTKMKHRELRKQSEKDGTCIECACCYADCAFEEMVNCAEEGHLFCVDCVRRHAEESIFGCGKLGSGGAGGDKDAASGGGSFGHLSCMNVDGCSSYFARDALIKCLPSKVMQKYDELQASQVLEKAGLLKDLCKCPKCDFQAIVPETQLLFKCPVDTCKFESCRLCGEASHVPLRCEEVEKKGETSARIRVEEAMTEAKVRKCPNGCAQPFYKVEGCNKMSCPTCHAFICYVCRKLIPKNVGYKHFCQTPHCKHENCNLCPLYSNAEEDDRRAAEEAGLKTVEQIRREEKNNGVDDTTKKIDIEEILKSPPTNNNSQRQAGLPNPRHYMGPPNPHEMFRHQQNMAAALQERNNRLVLNAMARHRRRR